MKDFRKIIGAALLVLVALLLTFRFKAILGWSPDFVIPILVALAFFLDTYSLLSIAVVAVWILNWQFGLPFELWVILAAPLIARCAKMFLPLTSLVTAAAVILMAEFALYTFGDGEVFWGNIGFIISNIVFAMFFGLATMTFLEYIYGKER